MAHPQPHALAVTQRQPPPATHAHCLCVCLVVRVEAATRPRRPSSRAHRLHQRGCTHRGACAPQPQPHPATPGVVSPHGGESPQ
jgi:hypothetical protein